MRKRLPTPLEFKLMSLVIRERTGRQVAKLYKQATGKSISPGTLYTTFRRLRDDAGWVAYRDEIDGDGRVRLIRLTGSGTRVLNDAREYYYSLAEFEAPEEPRAVRGAVDH